MLPRRGEKRKVGHRYLYGLLLVLLLILLIARPSAPSFLSSALYSVGEPIWGSEAVLGKWFSDAGIAWQEKQELTDRITTLEEELSRVELKALSQGLLEEENTRLKAMLNRALSEEPILAFVRARPPHTPYDTLILDAGESEGVSVGALVVSRDSVVLGTISKVSEHNAQALLFSAPDRESLVVIGPARTEATAIGRGGGNFEALIPRGVEVSVGDAVVMPAQTPRTFALVEEIIVRPTDAQQRVLFKNPINIFELSMVSVIPSVTILPPELFVSTDIQDEVATTTEPVASDEEEAL